MDWMIVIVVCALSLLVRDSESQQRCQSGGDLVFVLDSSGSLGRENFRREQEFAKNVVRRFDIGLNMVRVGAVSYSSDVVVNFDLDDKPTKSLLLGAMGFDMITFRNTKTATGDALAQVLEIMTPSNDRGARHNVAKAAIVLTDGMRNTGRLITSIAPRLASAGIKVVAVGVGDRVDRDELLEITNGNENNVIQLDDFDKLAGIVADIAQRVCSVDGMWSSWSSYASCSRYCGGGDQTRNRQCNNPAPSNGGRDCVGQSSSSRICNSFPCSVDGNWGPWSVYTSCSRSCGGGSQTRNRQCNNPRPQNEGDDCRGANSRTRACNSNVCAIDGGWGSWTAYERCSVTCGGSLTRKTRECNDPLPQGGGQPCIGRSLETRICNANIPCTVDGNWGPWSVYSSCSRPCGGGTSNRQRICNNPPPSAGGTDCQGTNAQSRACNNNACAVNGNWGQWSAFGGCSRSCGRGRSNRRRLCNNPPPSNGGEGCRGSPTSSRPCNTRSCEVNGNWGPWSPFNGCSACGGGTSSRTRICNSPPPSAGGIDCQGTNAQSRACNTNACPVNGNWGQWSAFGGCSRSCGVGRSNRRRLCNNPPPSNGGVRCQGSASNSMPCNTQSCGIDGDWTPWGPWGSCSQSCDGGFQRRVRTCTNPRQSGNGRCCEGSGTDVRDCPNSLICSADGGWGSWSGSSSCSNSCGGGFTYRERQCTDPSPRGSGNKCEGSAVAVTECNSVSCPVDGDYSSWGQWSRCSATCGGGSQIRNRLCNNPTPQNGGQLCTGVSQQNRTCQEACCNAWRFQRPYACGPNVLPLGCAARGRLEVFSVCERTGIRTCGRNRADILTSIRRQCDGNTRCTLASPCSQDDGAKLIIVSYRCCETGDAAIPFFNSGFGRQTFNRRRPFIWKK